VLNLAGRQLHELGYKLKSAHGLKPKHVEALVGRWHSEGLGAGTIKNRLTHLRWWGEKIGKTSIFKSNEDYGVERRAIAKGNKAQVLDAERLARVDCPYTRLSLRLQAAFGLRREEAVKFRVLFADQGDHIALKPSWTKGGRARVVPIRTERQRALLEEVRALTGQGSLIPPAKNYVQQLATYKHQTTKAGINNAHGLRHRYAQGLYKALTGWPAPAAGGPAYSTLSPAQKRVDYEARLEVSRELGHGRVDVTVAYLGGRS
jgi:integrase